MALGELPDGFAECLSARHCSIVVIQSERNRSPVAARLKIRHAGGLSSGRAMTCSGLTASMRPRSGRHQRRGAEDAEERGEAKANPCSPFSELPLSGLCASAFRRSPCSLLHGYGLVVRLPAVLILADGPNWVGYLVVRFVASARFRPRPRQSLRPSDASPHCYEDRKSTRLNSSHRT